MTTKEMSVVIIITLSDFLQMSTTEGFLKNLGARIPYM